MKNVCIFLTVLLATLASAEEPSDFIIGGNDALIGQFPWMASIRVGPNRSHGCGGGILNQNWVLTAAHCILRGIEHEIVVGSVRLQDPGERYPIIRVIPHPQYVASNSHWHDIGLVQTTTITFNQFVRPIPLQRRNFILGSRATLSGHGHYTTDLTNIRVSDHLQYKNTNILSNFDCQLGSAIAGIFNPDYRPIIYPGHICTLVQRGIGGCFGDSGSPLVANGAVVGVVSFGLSCARGAPDILIRVSHYIRWIDSQMGN